MKPDDVTDAMEFRFNKRPCAKFESMTSREIIAAAFNAVTSDDEPITAEWLLANGYKSVRLPAFSHIHRMDDALGVKIYKSKNPVVSYGVRTLPTKTIGQLLALHAGLGIGEVK